LSDKRCPLCAGTGVKVVIKGLGKRSLEDCTWCADETAVSDIKNDTKSNSQPNSSILDPYQC